MAAGYVDALWNGVDFWRWNSGSPIGTEVSITYSFATEIPSYYYDGDVLTSIDGGFSAFNADQRAAVAQVLSTYAEVAGLDFAPVADGQGGDIVFGMNLQGSSAGYAFFGGPWGGLFGDVWISNKPGSVLDTNLDVTPGTYGYLTLVHELGHSMGLKHTFQVNGAPDDGGSQVVLDVAHDSYRYSVMSYTHPSNELFMRVLNPGTVNEDLDYFRVYPTGPQLYDIAALQYLYGANTDTRAGPDTYSFDPDTPFFTCLWDGGGKDTVSVSSFTLGCRIDLGEGKFSDITILPDAIPAGWSAPLPTYDGKNNLSIAYGAKIENAIGGAGNDTLTGNSLGNALTGNAGADKLVGLAGADTMIGGAGKDQLTGSAGGDKFVFAVTATNSTADTIKDFAHDADEIQLDNAVFLRVGADGALADAAFYAGAAAHDGDDRVIYDSASGKLYYDPDGSSPKAQVLVAVLSGSPDDVDATDFLAI